MEPQKNLVSIHSIVNHNKTATEPPESLGKHAPPIYFFVPLSVVI